MIKIAELKLDYQTVRIYAKHNQKDWAKKLGVTHITVSSWEHNKTKPSFEQVRIMSELSGIPLENIKD